MFTLEVNNYIPLGVMWPYGRENTPASAEMTEETIDLGRFKGEHYHLLYRGDPNICSPDDFAVVVYYVDGITGDHVEIVRIDNSDGFTHMDCLHRRDHQKREVSLSMWEAVEKLLDEWRMYADGYRNAHG